MKQVFSQSSIALRLALMLPVSVAISCSAEPPSRTQEAIDEANDVSRLGVPLNFTTLTRDLPTQGDSRKFIWNGNWYPLSEGGTLDATRKYELATGGNGEAVAWEEDTVARQGHVEWAGHCNGLAAAGINEEVPKRDVTWQGQLFTIEDIKALLIEKWQGTQYVTLVGRRCSTRPVVDDSGRITNPGCRDMNAGALHVLLGNMLGKNKQPFIIDHTAGDEVWNFAVEGYRSTVEVIDPTTARQLTNISKADSYLWNPDATEFMKASTRVRLATGHTLKLDYVLELRHGSIIGGEWIGNSRQNHPDFAWTSTVPDPANPHLDVDVIDAIAKLSR
jgi:hypothetical protein